MPKIFFYGTLRKENPEDHPDFITRASFQGRLFKPDGAWFPAAVPSDDPDDHIIGEIYHIDNPATYDGYEGYYPKHPENSLYVRKEVDFIIPKGSKIWTLTRINNSIERIELVAQDKFKLPAWIYLYNRSLTDAKRIHSGNWIERLYPDPLERR